MFTCPIGDIATKVNVCESLIAKGAQFFTLIHKNTSIGLNTVIGEGSIVDDGAHIDPDVTIGTNCLIQAQSIIGHDSMIEDYVRIDTHSELVGGTVVKKGACIYTNAMINHNVVNR